MLTLFDTKLEEVCSGALHELVYTPNDDLLDALTHTLTSRAFNDEADVTLATDASTSAQRQQALIVRDAHRRHLVVAYGKLVLRGLLPVDRMAHLARHYVSHFHEFGDILKSMLGKVRELDKVGGCARMMARALELSYDTWRLVCYILCIHDYMHSVCRMSSLASCRSI